MYSNIARAQLSGRDTEAYALSADPIGWLVGQVGITLTLWLVQRWIYHTALRSVELADANRREADQESVLVQVR